MSPIRHDVLRASLEVSADTPPTMAIRGFQRRSNSEERVRPHQTPPVVVAGTSPLLYALPAGTRKPYLDGKQRDGFLRFKRDWEEWSRYQLVGLPQGPVGDQMVRDLLLTCLATAIADKYKAEISRRPGMTFQQVWDDLSKEYGLDNPYFFRQQWEAVKLHCTGEEISLNNFLQYRTRFETALARLTDYTDEEVSNAVLSQLPSRWVDRVVQREAKEAKDKHTVRITGALVEASQMKAILERALGVIKKVEQRRGCFWVELSTKEQMAHLLGVPDFRINGQRAEVQQVRARWKYGDIFNFLAEELRMKDESMVLKAAVPQVRFDPRISQAKASSPTSSSPSPAEKSKGGEKSHHPYPKTHCLRCKHQGRPYDHYWRTCKYEIEASTQKPAHSQGKGTGKGGGKGMGKGEMRSRATGADRRGGQRGTY